MAKKKGRTVRNEKLGVQRREFRLERGAVGKNRTITFPVSSEQPYERYSYHFGDYIEILDHSPGAVRLERFNDGAPLLKDHWRDQQIGVVEKGEIVDRRLIATARFGNSQLALDEEKDVDDGIRQKVSVGYLVHEMKLVVEHDDGPDEYRVTDWEPLETSTVAIPADPSVGFGRSEANDAFREFETRVIGRENRPKGDNMEIWAIRLEDGVLLRIDEKDFDEKKYKRYEAGDLPAPSPALDAAGPIPGIAAVPATGTASARELAQRNQAEAVADERTRVDEILAIGARFNCTDKAREAIAAGVSAPIFRDHVWSRQPQGKPLDEPAAHLGMSDGQAREFSIMSAIRAVLQNKPELAPFEMECSRAIAEKLGEEPMGFYVPADTMYVDDPALRSAVAAKRDLEVGVAASGGDIVATELRPGNFIEVLRNLAIVTRLGARMLPGLVGNVDLPRQSGAGAAGWIAEKGNAGVGELAVDLVSLTPKTIAVQALMTRRLMLQSTPAIEGLVRADLAMAIALGIDQAAINGAGSATVPEGILNTTGIGSVPLGTNGGAPTWGSIVQLIGSMMAANADAGTLGFAINANVWAELMQTEKATNTARFILEDPGNRLVGRRTEVSEQIPSNLSKGTGNDLSATIYGNWSDLLIGEWGTLDLFPDPYTEGGQGAVILRAFKDVDTLVRHPESFSAIVDMITTL